jgi:hypothetical protein
MQAPENLFLVKLDQRSMRTIVITSCLSSRLLTFHISSFFSKTTLPIGTKLHLGFPIAIKNRNLVKDFPMIIHVQFGFSQFISFREKDL